MKKILCGILAIVCALSCGFSVFAEENVTTEAEILKNLDILHGYEDGTFGLDKDITREEAVTLIVQALNETVSKDVLSAFSDVEGWSVPYVNAGVSLGFISGMGDGTFSPKDKITYPQMCTILMRLIGYGDYAQTKGGYPTGYTTLAADTKVSKGIINIGALTRGEVVKLLYNAMVTPMLGVTTYKLDGDEYAKLDGVGGNEFKTLLSDRYEGYNVKLTITNQGTDNKFSVTIDTKDYIPQVITSVIDDLGYAKNNMYLTGDAIITIDKDDKAHLVYFKQNQSNDAITFNAQDFEEIRSGNKIYFGNKYVTVDTAAKVVINGVEQTGFTLADFNNALGDITFSKENGSSVYNRIQISHYTVAKVASVVDENDTITVQFGKVYGNAVNGITIDKNQDLYLTGYPIAQLKKDDIIAFATNDTGTLDNPMYLDILKSDEKFEGQVVSYNTTEDKYAVNDTEYTSLKTGLAVGNYYAFTVDPFGRIFEYELIDSQTNYGIFVKDKDEQLTLIDAKGAKKTFDKDSKLIVPAGLTKGDVITYVTKVSNGNIKTIAKATTTTITLGEYRARTNRIDGYAINATTLMLHRIGTDEYETFNDFLDEVKYTLSAVIDTNTIKFGIIAEDGIGTVFNEDSRFAVVTKKAYTALNADEEVVYTLPVVYNGERTEYVFETDPNKNVGDIIYTRHKGEYDELLAATDIAYTTDIQLVEGMIIDIDTNSIEIYQGATTDTFTRNGCKVIGIDPACIAYKYNKDDKKVSVVNYTNIVPTILMDADDTNAGNLKVATGATPVHVKILVVNKEAVIIYVD